MAYVEESKKDRKKAPIRSQQNRSNMPQGSQAPQSQNLAKKHKKLQDSQKPASSSGSHVIGGAANSAIPYRVSRVAQPTQHKSSKFQVIAENNNTDEDDDLDDTWI